MLTIIVCVQESEGREGGGGRGGEDVGDQRRGAEGGERGRGRGGQERGQSTSYIQGELFVRP